MLHQKLTATFSQTGPLLASLSLASYSRKRYIVVPQPITDRKFGLQLPWLSQALMQEPTSVDCVSCLLSFSYYLK
jgi:hypothetical protein